MHVLQVDRILEALVIWREGRDKMVGHKEECKAAGREVCVCVCVWSLLSTELDRVCV